MAQVVRDQIADSNSYTTDRSAGRALTLDPAPENLMLNPAQNVSSSVEREPRWISLQNMCRRPQENYLF